MGIDLFAVSKGIYKGTVIFSSEGKKEKLNIQLEVSGEVAKNHGFDNGKSLSRMEWLNNTLGIDDEITSGYIPVKRTGNTLKVLGRTVSIAANGLPSSALSYFTSSNQSIGIRGEPVISSPCKFVIEKENGAVIKLQSGMLQFTGQTTSGISWQVKSSSSECELICYGRLEFDGFMDYKLSLKAIRPLKIKDIRLEIPMNKAKAEYMMGLNHEGGFRPSTWKWQWDTTKNQDILWIGSVNGGLQVKLKAENYRPQLVNAYYAFSPLNLPPSWGNHNKGGIIITQNTNDVKVNIYSGKRNMAAATTLHYDFELLLTPFHTINNKIKYGDRYYHDGGITNSFGKIEDAKKAGANIINIHHAESVYPFINYPYLDENISDLRQLVDNAHQNNLRMKFYYTTRELTKNIPEFYPFYSLDGELIFPGPGNSSHTSLHPEGPDEWLKKNLREKYIPAWYNPIKEGKFKGQFDLSVITTPGSRLNNFYIGGLDWMLANLDIDGVYIDDAALDRFTIRRARKLIDKYRPAGRIDMHSWNHFNDRAGYASCLNLYMSLLPYIDLVWIGEERDYDRMPDHWLVEVSGIPFGLPGQMLPEEGKENPWRGMVYGITDRASSSKNTPTAIWEFWDRYTIKDKDLIGYWDSNCPVITTNELVKASFFRGTEENIIAVANWSAEDQPVFFSIDWKKIGIDSSKFSFAIPKISGYQDEMSFPLSNKLTIPAKKGYLIVMKPGQE